MSVSTPLCFCTDLCDDRHVKLIPSPISLLDCVFVDVFCCIHQKSEKYFLQVRKLVVLCSLCFVPGGGDTKRMVDLCKRHITMYVLSILCAHIFTHITSCVDVSIFFHRNELNCVFNVYVYPRNTSKKLLSVEAFMETGCRLIFYKNKITCVCATPTKYSQKAIYTPCTMSI